MRWQWLSSSFTVVFFVGTAVSSVFGQAFHFDQNRSKIEFELSHLGVLTVNGAFKIFSGSMVKTKEGWIINGAIDVKSIDTGNSERDATVLGEQYLNTTQFQKIEFVGRAVATKNQFAINGFLSLRGVNKSISFSLLEKENSLSGELLISRKYFHLNFGGMDDLIGDEITVMVTLIK